MSQAYNVSVRKSEKQREIAETLGKAILEAKRAKWDEVSEGESSKIFIVDTTYYHYDLICYFGYFI